jgi:hypothetical protein
MPVRSARPVRPTLPLLLLGFILSASAPAGGPAPATAAPSASGTPASPGSIAAAARSGHDAAAGSFVSVSVFVDGASVPLHHRGDRWYLEAREGSEYAVQVANLTSQRLGVALQVDGLDAISGERSGGRWASSPPGRLYVLDPWAATIIRGWRTSLDEVQRFTFVDERASYAEQSGKANARMGWIEVVVYRERARPPVVGEPGRIGSQRKGPDAGAQREGADEAAGARSRDAAAAPQARSGGAEPEPAQERADVAGGARRAYPGTGWGPRTEDRVVVVAFEPERRPVERITLRYEYRETLIALGILPRLRQEDDRLARRERGEGGFAAPPLR